MCPVSYIDSNVTLTEWEISTACIEAIAASETSLLPSRMLSLRNSRRDSQPASLQESIALSRI
jgi:hypothetical protein